MYVDLLTTYPTLNIATPVILAVASIAHYYSLRCIPSATAHGSATSSSRMVLDTLPVIAANKNKRNTLPVRHFEEGVFKYC
jgi:hypothetical protein